MSVAIVGSPASISEGSAVSYTAEPGSGRVLVLAGTGESAFSSRPLVGVTFGGIAMTPIYTGNTANPKGGLYYLKESEIPAGSNDFAFDWGGQLHESFQGAAYTLSGVDQTSPVADSAAAADATGSLDALDLSLTSVAGSVIVVGGGNHATSYSISTASTNAASTQTFTTLSSMSASHQGFGMSASVAAGQAETIGVRWNATGQITAAAAVFKPPTASTTPGITTKTLERNGVAVGGTTAAVMVWSGTALTGTPVYTNASVAVASGALAEIDLSSTGLAVGADIVVAILPTDGPGIVIQTTVEDTSA